MANLIDEAVDPVPRPGVDEDAGAVRIGRYEVIERIGVGGMAEAFRARARGPGGYQRELIIKRILPHLADSGDFVRGFVDEAKILGMLNHPNIVGVYDFGVDQDGHHYLALEYLDGAPLVDILIRLTEEETMMPLGVAAYIAREVCHGLSAAHTLTDLDGNRLNIVHRDVTPSNIMTTRSGSVKLLDFGVARIGLHASVSQHGYIKGKAGYLAPEQVRGEPIDARVDLFALGVVLYEMLCLEHLFHVDDQSMASAVYRILEMPIPLPSTVRKEIPPALENVVMKALCRDRDQRYGAAAEMARDLDSVVADSGLRPADMASFFAQFAALRPNRSDAVTVSRTTQR
jgi:eukaryotic-like serine/threonine-protein kinase